MGRIIKRVKRFVNLTKLNGLAWAFGTFSSKFVKKNRIPTEYRACFENKYGFEIGGPSSVFGQGGMWQIYNIVARIDNCNFSDRTIWEGKIKRGMNFQYHKHKKGHQYICEATELSEIESKKYDFVVSSHVIEHIANPLKALKELVRILKDDGVLLLIVPHKDGTSDYKRQVTSVAHLIKDQENEIQEDDTTHFNEVMKLHDLATDIDVKDMKTFKERIIKNRENRCLHHHSFDTALMTRIFELLNLQIIFVGTEAPHHIIIMGKKTSGNQKVDNKEFISSKAQFKKSSPFKSDRTERSSG